MKHVFLFFLFLINYVSGGGGSSEVAILTDDNYEKLVTHSSDLWLLEFYAPWCGHCKRLRPILDELAKNQSEKFPMRIGVMDATAEKVVPGKFGIKSYPTIKYFKDGIYGKYEGPRNIEGFLKFSERMHGPSITELNPDNVQDQLQAMLSKSPVLFLLTYNGNNIPNVFQSVARALQAQASFAAVPGVETSLAKLENGRELKKLDINGIDLSNTDGSKLEEIVKSNNHPLVSALDSHNFKQLGSLNKVMAIAVVDYSDKELATKMISTLDIAASSLVAAHADRFIFGHLDGVHWKMFLKQYDAKVTSLLLLDLSKETFHSATEISDENSVRKALMGLVEGTVKMNPVPSKGFFADIQKKLSYHYPYSLLCLVPVALIALSFLLQHPDDKKAKKD